MVYIIANTIIPTHKAVEVSKALEEHLQKFDFTRFNEITETIISNAIRTTLHGAEMINVIEVKDDANFLEALEIFKSWYYRYIPIEGFEVSINVYNTADETFKLLGFVQ